MAARRRASAGAGEAGAPKKTKKETAAARDGNGSVMADDGALYVLTLCERIVLDVLAYEDEGLLAFVRIDGEVVAELPVLGQA
jgi:hypothetical protein